MTTNLEVLDLHASPLGYSTKYKQDIWVFEKDVWRAWGKTYGLLFMLDRPNTVLSRKQVMELPWLARGTALVFFLVSVTVFYFASEWFLF